MGKQLTKEAIEINLHEFNKSKKKTKLSKIHKKFLIKNLIFFTSLLLIMIIITKTNKNTANEIIRIKENIYNLNNQEKQCRNDIIRIKQRNKNYMNENRNLGIYLISLNDSISQLKQNKTHLKLQIEGAKNRIDSLRYSKKNISDNISFKKFNIEAYTKQYNELEIINSQFKKQYISLSKVSKGEYQELKSLLLSKEEITILEKWMDGIITKKCYSSNSAQLNVTIFHQNCDQVGPTLTVVLTNFNELIGGYTRVSWGNKEDRPDYRAFIFNIKKKKICHLMPFVTGILPKPEHFPFFGIDLMFRGDGSDSSNFPYVYGDYSNKKAEFIENAPFLIRHIEVFAIKEN